MSVIELVKKATPGTLKSTLKQFFSFFMWDRWARPSWSQEGEDQILQRIFERKKNGFYIDVGAHHPRRFSNTFLFYKRGWRGINIDAMPGSMRAFRKTRPRDLNLEIGIGEQEGTLEYFMFNEPALNGFSRDLSYKRSAEDSGYRIKTVVNVDVLPLREVLDKYLPIDQVIDFMSVDVEGLDLQVLKSNDWERFRPTYTLVEILGSSFHRIDQSDIGQFMREAGYVPFAKCMTTVFFKASAS